MVGCTVIISHIISTKEANEQHDKKCVLQIVCIISAEEVLHQYNGLFPFQKTHTQDKLALFLQAMFMWSCLTTYVHKPMYVVQKCLEQSSVEQSLNKQRPAWLLEKL